MKKSYVLLAVLLGSLWFSTAFQRRQLPEEVEKLVQQTIAERVEKFKKRRMEDCRRQAMTRANEIVDSLLILSVKAIKEDSIIRPPKPIKPDKPIMDIPVDTTPIAPILPIDTAQ